jgi:hypothetical protein
MSTALRLLPLCALVALFHVNQSVAVQPRAYDCAHDGSLCTETANPIGYDAAYTGHDEPSLLFYSEARGSGNRLTWKIRLPAEPPVPPNQLATGGTFNFQLHPAFWFGMVVCDDQSAPNPGGSTVNGVALPNVPCKPDSDANIFDNSTVADPRYMGRHPGTGFVEMQFYPADSPIGCGNPHHPHQWCAALNIDSASENQNNGTANNADCQKRYGTEYVNYAFITKSGTPEGPSALIGSTGFFGFTPSDNDTLFFNGGDVLLVDFADTPHGLRLRIVDLTTGERGSMVASAANGFTQLLFQPSAKTCSIKRVDFHPAYATSSEHTRNTWTAHSYNIAFSDEIGHYEYCNKVDTSKGNSNTDAFGDVFSADCSVDGVHDLNSNNSLVGDDDTGCVDTTNNTAGYVPNIGCTGTDTDFDGVPYQLVWPGTNRNPRIDRALHPAPITLASPLFRGDDDDQPRNFSRVAFEANLPRIEAADFGGNCNRTTGAGCTNPPPNANFYPIYSIQADERSCVWNLGGPFIPGTVNSFGGNSVTEYGALFTSIFPSTKGPQGIIENYRRILPFNPCRARPKGEDED